MFRRLLVPLDGSRLAEAVLAPIERLAPALDATVVLLHVLERGAPPTIHGDRHLSQMEEATAYLEGVAERLRRQGIRVEQHTHDVPEGNVTRSIVEHAEEKAADLIVLATHGSGGMRDLLFGSIAQQVLQGCTRAVLLVRPLPSSTDFDPHTVLIPLDGTDDAETAITPGRELAEAFQATVHLVMVVPTLETISGNRAATATLLPMATRAALNVEEQEASDYLQDEAEPLRAVGLSVTTEVRRGDVPAALAAAAAEPGVGLVVLATHGRSGLQASWTRSVAAQILSRVRVPVLLLRTVAS